MLSPVELFVENLGGSRKVGHMVGLKHNAVSMWRAQGYIPPRHLFRLREIAAEQGLEAPDNLFQKPERAEAEAA